MRNSLIVRAILVFGAFLFAASIVGCSGNGGRKVADSLEQAQVIDLSSRVVDTLDFGRVRAGEVVELSLALTNSSEAPLLVLSTETSCGCLKMDGYSREPLHKGAKMGAKMTFYSLGYNYFPPRTFYVVTSTSLEPKRLVVVAEMIE